jgi:hypothetical protein
MSYENPENIIRSWNVQTNFATGPVTADQLVPPQYSRIRTPFLKTWREEALNTTLNWGSSNFSIYLPESLRVVSDIYLRIRLDALPSSTYKKYPGLYCIKSIRLLSQGQEVYNCDFMQFMADHLQQYSEEELNDFSKVFLGGESSLSLNARDVMCPIFLPNSPFLSREGKDTRGHGVFPCYLGTNRLEVQITMNAANYPSMDTTVDSPTISGRCSIMYNEVKMTGPDLMNFSDHRGKYSIINRRFTELTSGWVAYTSGPAVFNINQPQGVVTEVQLIAVADSADESRHGPTYIKPTKFKVTADSIVQKDLNTQNKIDAELWSNGFVQRNADFPAPGRLCFAAHCAENSHVYTGGYNQQLASTIQYDFEFAAACRYKIVAVQLQRVRIDSTGRITATLN